MYGVQLLMTLDLSGTGFINLNTRGYKLNLVNFSTFQVERHF